MFVPSRWCLFDPGRFRSVSPAHGGTVGEPPLFLPGRVGRLRDVERRDGGAPEARKTAEEIAPWIPTTQKNPQTHRHDRVPSTMWYVNRIRSCTRHPVSDYPHDDRFGCGAIQYPHCAATSTSPQFTARTRVQGGGEERVTGRPIHAHLADSARVLPVTPRRDHVR